MYLSTRQFEVAPAAALLHTTLDTLTLGPIRCQARYLVPSHEVTNNIEVLGAPYNDVSWIYIVVHRVLDSGLNGWLCHVAL